MKITFLRAGPHTTVQDHGRHSLQHLGVGVSGAMDLDLYMVAQEVYGNKVLEFYSVGPKIKTDCDVELCVLKDSKIEYKTLKKNEIYDTGSLETSNVGYITFSRDIDIQPVADSYSIDTRGGIGPNQGKKFNNGDIIFLLNLSKKASRPIIKPKQNNLVTRVHKGPQYHLLGEESIKKFTNNTFKISNYKDRTGVWLDGISVPNNLSKDIMSEGIIKGSVQITPSGKLVVLLADHGTVGGYPKIAVLDSSEISTFSQKIAGSEVRFEFI